MWQVSHFLLSPGPWLQGYLCSDDLRGKLRRSCASGLLQEWLDAELREPQVCMSVCGRLEEGLTCQGGKGCTHKGAGEEMEDMLEWRRIMKASRPVQCSPSFPCPNPSHPSHFPPKLLHQVYSAEHPLLTATSLDVASHGLVLLSDDSAWAQGIEAAVSPQVRGMMSCHGRNVSLSVVPLRRAGCSEAGVVQASGEGREGSSSLG